MNKELEPHFEVNSAELAAWIEKQGDSVWWNVDGDPVLTDRLSFPCPGDELAVVLRRLNRAIIVRDPQGRQDADGHAITAAELDSVADRLGNEIEAKGAKPPWAEDRVFCCRWKGTQLEWLLVEDKETSSSNQRDEMALHRKK